MAAISPSGAPSHTSYPIDAYDPTLTKANYHNPQGKQMGRRSQIFSPRPSTPAPSPGGIRDISYVRAEKHRTWIHRMHTIKPARSGILILCILNIDVSKEVQTDRRSLTQKRIKFAISCQLAQNQIFT
jgi:hypothetical protein